MFHFTGLEYGAEQLPEQGIKERIRQLQVDLGPRNQCWGFVATRSRGKATLMTREEFYAQIKEKRFSEGPFEDAYGDGCGPYNLYRQAFGQLESGPVIYCELSRENGQLTDELFELIERES